MPANLRNVGAASALAHAGVVWAGLAEYFVYRYLVHAGPDGALFEEARDFAVGCFNLKPPNPYAWGALALGMSSAGMIEKTGVRRRSHAFHSNHAREAAVWRINPDGPEPKL